MKLNLLRQLLDLNQAFEQVIHGLARMEKGRIFQVSSLRYARAEVETARVDANREFFDHFREIVENEGRWAYKFRREYDRKTKDPFDFYLELDEREEARKRKGLPPRAVLLPGWDEDDGTESAAAGKRVQKRPRPKAAARAKPKPDKAPGTAKRV